MSRRWKLGKLAFLLLVGACNGPGSNMVDDVDAAPAELPVGVVDSVFPVEEEIRRFAASVDRTPASLTGGAAARDALVEQFIHALEQSDTAALAAAVLDRAEFIHLYFPHTVYTRTPYEMDPAFIWFQMVNHSSRGLSRAYRLFAGKELDYGGHTCAPETVEGPNRIWDRCVVRIAPDGEALELRLFGLIVEHGGHYKFVTYGNEL